MFKVGLTGNVAAGKSTVVRVWRSLGAKVVESDELARRAVEPGTRALAAIVERWGPGVLSADGRLDRVVLRDIVFRDRAERSALEEIIHPEVERMRHEAFNEARREGIEMVAADIPLLFEARLEDRFDAIVLVDAPANLRRERLVRDRGLAADEADRIIEAQWPADRKRARADYVIENTGSVVELQARAGEVWGELTARARAHGEAHG